MLINEKRQKLADELATVLDEPVEGSYFKDDDQAMPFAIDQIRQYRAKKRKRE